MKTVRIARLMTVGMLAAGASAAYRSLIDGGLTIDVGIGRRQRSLGPMNVEISAPRDVVFDVIAAPYLGKTPHAMRDKLEVLERGHDMVLAAHHTDIGRGRRATTIETVRFERPDVVHFRLVRGPVAEVVETFELAGRTDDRTCLVYAGTLSTDWWGAGAGWGKVVARKWEDAVRSSIANIAAEAEHRARHGSTLRP
jgi:hypothetical protein